MLCLLVPLLHSKQGVCCACHACFSAVPCRTTALTHTHPASCLHQCSAASAERCQHPCLESLPLPVDDIACGLVSPECLARSTLPYSNYTRVPAARDVGISCAASYSPFQA
ncbi:hypothetical protein COO60DRAFT_1498844 [Scenedesmus sp. NREL 46B-D3]|nr:hypothetical protein COO60DRAFT_1498844 [Scenedesmus sp. NREL 46B-D3]